ncbi:MAG: NUDIX hydrolase [Armatimonadetes bacterium]|nr:NUDIX hydrolase [Armatimonadota bacterium]
MPDRLEVIARVVAVDAGGRILLTQRAGRDYWVPPGGHVDPGESLPEAARREVREEARLEVEIGHLLYVWELVAPDRHRVEVCFRARLAAPPLGAEATAEDLGPAGGLRHRRLFPPDALPSLPLYPAALATPGLLARLRSADSGSSLSRDPYLGREGAHLSLPHRVNVRVILAQEERVLLVSDDRQEFWVLPGGLVGPGETLEAAAVREVEEETGLRARAQRLLYLREFVDEALGAHGIECYFLGRAGGGALRMGADPDFRDPSTARGTVTRARWWPRERLDQITVYPEALRQRVWADLARGGADLFLGLVRLA